MPMKCKHCGKELKERPPIVFREKIIHQSFFDCGCTGEKREREMAAEKEIESARYKAALSIHRQVLLHFQEAGLSEDALSRRISDLTVRDSNRAAMATARDVIDGKTGRSGIYIEGPPGTGKTYLLTAMGVEFIRKGLKISYVYAGSMRENLCAREINDREIRQSAERRYAFMVASDVIMIDDIGIEDVNSVTENLVMNIVGLCYASKKRLCITSNLTLDALCERYGAVTAERIYRRIAARCELVKLAGTIWME